MSNLQPDLFGNHPAASGDRAPVALEPPPAEFVARIRDELEGTLSKVREAARHVAGSDPRDARGAALPFDRQMAARGRGRGSARGVRGGNRTALRV